MADMATTPVFACRKCGRPVAVKLSSINDPKAEKLKEFMRGLHEIALCKYCQMQYNWLASQGRSDEFYKNPQAVLYSVLDFSGVDYYRKAG